MRVYLFIFLIFLQLVSFSQADLDIYCTSKFCEDYEKKHPCPELSSSCKIQNATHNGLFLPFRGPCNCCKYCIDNLGLNSECAVGSPGGLIPDAICGDGLYCNENEKKCVSMPTPCFKDQKVFDEKRKNGTLGFLETRPQCDRKGQYSPVKCIPGQTCFCVDEDGNRIFGDIPYSLSASDITNCACSRSVQNINKIVGEYNYSLKRPKCLPNGNFDDIQCIEKDCFCVNKFTGSRINPAQKPENIHLISKMPCFNNNSHPEKTYLKSCELEFNNTLKCIEKHKETGFDFVLGYKLPLCQLDGRFAAVQETKDHKFCSDPEGNKLETFIIPKNDTLSTTMNCNCARATKIIPWLEKPKCCRNGNYACVQCWQGKCYCVDSNGLQVEKQVPFLERNSLSCNYDFCVNNCTV